VTYATAIELTCNVAFLPVPFLEENFWRRSKVLLLHRDEVFIGIGEERETGKKQENCGN
jgi:hypothetical protein